MRQRVIDIGKYYAVRDECDPSKFELFEKDGVEFSIADKIAEDFAAGKIKK